MDSALLCLVISNGSTVISSSQSVEVYGPLLQAASLLRHRQRERCEVGRACRCKQTKSLSAVVFPGLTPLRPPRPRSQTRSALKIHLQGSNPRLQGFALCHTVAPDTQVPGCAYPCT